MLGAPPGASSGPRARSGGTSCTLRSVFTPDSTWSPSGVWRRDPSTQAVARALESRFLALSAKEGYAELGLSSFTPRPELEKSTGAGSDVVAKELVALDDGVYAPEGTPQVLSYAFDAPGRYAYVQSMMRGERVQRGRLREFTQFGVEEVGSRKLSPLSAVASLTLMVEVLGGFECTVGVGYLGCAECQGSLRAALLEVVPTCADCERRQGSNPVRMLDCKVCDRSTWPTFDSVGCEPCTADRDLFLALLPFEVVYDPYLVRGLDYYQGPVWEVTCGGLVVGGGGMYAAEVSRKSSVRTLTGVGWALGLERLLLQSVPPELPPGPPTAAVIASGVEDLIRARDLARMEGRTVLYGSLRDVLRRADLMRSPDVLVLGDRELASGQGVLKDLATGSQVLVPLVA